MITKLYDIYSPSCSPFALCSDAQVWNKTAGGDAHTVSAPETFHSVPAVVLTLKQCFEKLFSLFHLSTHLNDQLKKSGLHSFMKV